MLYTVKLQQEVTAGDINLQDVVQEIDMNQANPGRMTLDLGVEIFLLPRVSFTVVSFHSFSHEPHSPMEICNTLIFVYLLRYIILTTTLSEKKIDKNQHG